MALPKFQFSLRSLLLFVLFASMAMSLFVTERRLLRVEAKLADYRREYGILDVEENPTKVQAVARWTPDRSYQWRWRVLFPPGKYEIHYATSGIPENGFPREEEPGDIDLRRFGGPSGPFPVDISAAVYKDPKDGKSKLRVTCGCDADCNYSSCEMISDVSMVLDGEYGRHSSGVKWDDGPALVSPEQPLVLLRIREVSDDGLMIWIRRADESSGKASSAGK